MMFISYHSLVKHKIYKVVDTNYNMKKLSFILSSWNFFTGMGFLMLAVRSMGLSKWFIALLFVLGLTFFSFGSSFVYDYLNKSKEEKII